MKDSTTPRMILTAAVFAALAMLVVAPAQAYFADVDGGGPVGTLQVGSGEQSLGLTGDSPLTRVERQADDRLDTAIQTAMRARAVEQTVTQEKVSPYAGKIPYLSHGIGVDESLFSGQQSLGLTGDSPLTRVAAPEPEGLTGDSALTRVGTPVAGTPRGTTSGGDFDWTAFGIGGGLAAILVAAMAGLLVSARRGRMALP